VNVAFVSNVLNIISINEWMNTTTTIISLIMF